MNFKNRGIIDINNFSKEELLYILETAAKFDPGSTGVKNPQNPDLIKGTITALCFFEPSTRTEQSFKAAIQKIGGGVIGFNDRSLTSMNKGETFSDTIQIISGYADVLVVRHPEAGSAQLVADLVDIPVINAGDGTNQHPTQTMLDIYTIMQKFGRLDNLKIAFVGDPKHYRTIHGLSIAMSKFANNQIFGISPEGLEMPAELKTENYQEVVIDMKDLNETLGKIAPDIVYVGRIPKEYMAGESTAYNYQINKGTLAVLPEKTIIMHPLPRVDEIDIAVDKDPRAIYFEQAKNGLYVRTALLALILGKIG